MEEPSEQRFFFWSQGDGGVVLFGCGFVFGAFFFLVFFLKRFFSVVFFSPIVFWLVFIGFKM